MKLPMKNSVLIALFAVLLSGSIVGGYAWYSGHIFNPYDEPLRSALKALQRPDSYEMSVETRTVLSGRTIVVSGLYRLDKSAKRFGSYATTTLTIPDEMPARREHIFTLDNVSIGEDIYLRIDTQSPLLKMSIPYSSAWRHFNAREIPTQFTDIAVSGPVLDDLALLSSNGRYLSPSGEPRDVSYEGTDYDVYAFTLSERSADITGGTLESLVHRIGGGNILLWIADSQIRMLTFEGENYLSTTSIRSVNTALNISPPERFE